MTLRELLGLSVPQFSFLLNGLLNTLKPKNIRNTQWLNKVDLVTCGTLEETLRKEPGGDSEPACWEGIVVGLELV